MIRTPSGLFLRIACLLKAAPLLALVAVLSSIPNAPALAQSVKTDRLFAQMLRPDARQLEQQAKERYQRGDFDGAIQLWQQLADSYAQQGNAAGAAESLTNQSVALRSLGLYRRAMRSLEEAYQLLKSEPDSPLKAASLRHFGNTLRLLGEVGNLDYLDSSCQVVNPLSESSGGSPMKSGQVLGESLAIATRLQDSQAIGESFLSLGYAAQALFEKERALGRQEEALEEMQKAASCYQLAASISQLSTQTRSQLNVLSLLADALQWLIEPEQQSLAATWLPQIQAQIQSQVATWRKLQSQIDMLPQQTAIYARLDFAKILTKLNKKDLSPLPPAPYPQGGPHPSPKRRGGKVGISPPSLLSPSSLLSPPSLLGKGAGGLGFFPDIPSWENIARLLAATARQAKELKEPRAESYALGYLGEVYEDNGQWFDAEKVTQQALVLAQTIKAPEIAYQWEWQLGRLLKKQGKKENAIAAYEAAVASLQWVRQDLVAVNADVQFSFRDNVEPIYREFVELLLPSPGTQPDSKNLDKARKAIAALQVAELENFLRCTLQKEQLVNLDTVAEQSGAAIFYPIILENRLAVIVYSPTQFQNGSNLIYYEIAKSRYEVDTKIKNFRLKVENPLRFTLQEKREAEELYNWLIRPAEQYLDSLPASAKIKTLVFVLDGQLRNIPMAALYDGERYPIEKYAIAVNLGLELQNPEPLRQKNLSVVTAGITQALRGMPPLPQVEEELKFINSIVPSRGLLDNKFVSGELKHLLESQSFSIVHLATHGEFSSQPEKTSIQAWDAPINVSEMSEIFRSQKRSRPDPIELLVLSACQTAEGDNRAMLGLAGVAVRSGARSAIASLWYLNDASSALLMKNFYRHLSDPAVTSKAEALRLAQLDMLKNSNPKYAFPAYWAAYILVGNWL